MEVKNYEVWEKGLDFPFVGLFFKKNVVFFKGCREGHRQTDSLLVRERRPPGRALEEQLTKGEMFCWRHQNLHL